MEGQRSIVGHLVILPLSSETLLSDIPVEASHATPEADGLGVGTRSNRERHAVSE
jgi:hypothetical protein